MSKKIRRRKIRDSLDDYYSKYLKSKGTLVELKFIYGAFHKLKKTIDRFPGGYNSFTREHKGFSDATLSSLRNEIEDEIFAIEDDAKKEKRKLESIPVFVEINRFIASAIEYVQEVQDEHCLNSAWLVIYYDPAIHGIVQNRISKGYLTINNDFRAELNKSDSPLDKDYRSYRGSLEKLHGITNEKAPLSLTLKSDEKHCFSLIMFFKDYLDFGNVLAERAQESKFLDHLSRMSENTLKHFEDPEDNKLPDFGLPDDLLGDFESFKKKFALGVYNQFDGRRIHAGRVLMVYLGTSDQPWTQIEKKGELEFESFKKNDFKRYNHFWTDLSYRNESYICAIDLHKSEHDKPFEYIHNGMVFPSNSDLTLSKSLVSEDNPICYLGADFFFSKERHSDLHEIIESLLNQINENGVKSAYMKQDNFMKPDDYKKMCLPTSDFVFLYSGIGNTALSLMLLGSILQNCKNVILIFNKDKVESELLHFLKMSHNPIRENVSFIEYRSLARELPYIRSEILSLLRNAHNNA